MPFRGRAGTMWALGMALVFGPEGVSGTCNGAHCCGYEEFVGTDNTSSGGAPAEPVLPGVSSLTSAGVGVRFFANDSACANYGVMLAPNTQAKQLALPQANCAPAYWDLVHYSTDATPPGTGRHFSSAATAFAYGNFSVSGEMVGGALTVRLHSKPITAPVLPGSECSANSSSANATVRRDAHARCKAPPPPPPSYLGARRYPPHDWQAATGCLLTTAICATCCRWSDCLWTARAFRSRLPCFRSPRYRCSRRLHGVTGEWLTASGIVVAGVDAWRCWDHHV